MKTSSRITTAAALAVLTGSAFGMQPAKESGGERPARDRTVLRGPDDAGRPDRGERAAERPERSAEQARAAANPGFQMIVMAIRGLQRSEDQSLRLTEDQTAQIRAISVEYREATQKFMEENKDEIAKIRAVAGENRAERANDRPGARPGDRPGQNKDTADRPGARPTPGEGNTDRSRRPGSRTTTEMEVETDAAPSDGQQYTPEQRAEAREKLRAMMEAAPHEKQAKQKLMAVLTEPQKARVAEIMKAQAERIRDRAQGDQPGVRPQRASRPSDAAPSDQPADRIRSGDRPQRRPAQRPGSDD